MAAHAITIDTRGLAYVQRYRWRCSCGLGGERWVAAVRSARCGGARHVAAMEKR